MYTSLVSKPKIFISKPTLLLILVSLGILMILLIATAVKSAAKSAPVVNNQKVEIAAPKKNQSINKDFTFPVDQTGNKLTDVKFNVDSAELRDEVLIKGQKASSIKGKIFLIVNLKLTNSTNQPFNLNSRDYIRLSVNGNDNELLAPDIHNDPVGVEGISTKYTRVGFSINETDKAIKLHIGDVTKPGTENKSIIDLNF